VCDNSFVNQDGKTVVLRGANTEGTQYDCVLGGAGFYEDPTISPGNYATEITALKSWGINVVQVNLNPDCWLGIDGVPASTSATGFPVPPGDTYNTSVNAYMNEIGNYVAALNAAGIYAELNLDADAPQSFSSTYGPGYVSNPLPGDVADMFWESVASYFSENHAVIFGGLSQSFPSEGDGWTPPDWACILDGCVISSYLDGNAAGYQFGYSSEGVAQLIQDIRQYDTTAPLLVAGPETAGDMAQWLAYFYPGGASIDPNNKLATSFNVSYPFESSLCSDASDVAGACPGLDAGVIVQVALFAPVLTDVVGDLSCSNADVFSFLQSIDAEDAGGPLDIGYLGSAWTTYGCDGNLITSWTTGAPSTMGVPEYCELLNVGVAPEDNGLFSPSDYCSGTVPDTEPR
jgi:hypothetical protein